MAKTNLQPVPPNEEPKELALVRNYMVLGMEQAELKSLLRENLGNAQITALDLPRLKVPAGGETFWSVPTLKGKKAQEEVEGVIVYVKSPRRFWKERYGSGGSNNAPPDCISEDGEIGFGDNTEGIGRHDCDTCPMSQWGTAVDAKGNPTRGQACQDRRVLFLLTETGVLPYAVDLPPTSGQAVKTYLVGLLNAGLRYMHVTTKLRLETDRNDTGTAYSRVVLEPGTELTPDIISRVEAYAADIRPSLQKARLPVEALSE